LRSTTQTVYNVTRRFRTARREGRSVISMHATHPDERERTKQLGLFGEPATSSVRPEIANVPKPPTVDEIVQSALDHLNEVTERTGAARFTSPTSAKARVQDGATAEDLLLVIDFCHAMWWGDPKMETFVRPKTLFGKENFPDYLARARKWRVEGRPALGSQNRSSSLQGGYARGADYYAKKAREEGTP